MADVKERAVSVGLLAMLIAAIGGAIGIHLHLETQSEDKARAAVVAHEFKRIESAHPDIHHDVAMRSEMLEMVHKMSQLRRDVDELRELCSTKGRRR